MDNILSIRENGLNVDLYENVILPHFFSDLENEIEYLKGIKYRSHPVPRQMVAYGDSPLISYSFSGLKIKCKPWTPTLFKMKQIVENKISVKGYNYVLINKYRGGYDYISRHKDDETDLDPHYPIAAVSLGETRTIVFTSSTGGEKRTVQIPLPSGSLLVMKPPTNDCWFHEIPREPDRRGVRISLTFRKMLYL